MFIPKTDRIRKLATVFPNILKEVDNMFSTPTNVYIDWQNVIHWQDKLGWHISAKRLKQFFDSFDTIRSVSLYTGTLDGNLKSEEDISDLRGYGYRIETKLVKIMPHSIDTSSVPKNSPTLLEPFIKKPFLSVLTIETIEYLNAQLENLNKQGIMHIIDKKCNFDVEIGRDMFLDLAKGETRQFILWSGDSDFVDPIQAIIKDGKKVFLFATAGRVSRELSDLMIPVFEIKKIKEFICWPKELPDSIRDKTVT
ncbi:NYN domain-containing protein [bacterium]|nr:MAG: NYN domain-containing protein [bacterium]